MSGFTRRFFVGSGATALLVAGSSLWACRSRSVQQARAQYDRLDIMLQDIVDPIRIGKASRDKFGQGRLYTVAEQNPHIREAMRYECPSKRRDILCRGTRQDFAARKTVLCDRFIVSETECIVAGLRYDAGMWGSLADI